MTLSYGARQSPLYTGNGVSTNFDFSFRAFPTATTTGIAVFAVAAGGEFNEISNTSYSVQYFTEAGRIVFNTAPAVGVQFYIFGKTSVDQQLDITNYDNFYPDALEKALDRGTAIMQEAYTLVQNKESALLAADLILRTSVNTAITNASSAVSTATIASANATTALVTANGIDAKATTALSNSSTALSTANGIDAKATTALTNSTNALNTANSALVAGNFANSKADAAVSTANGIDAKATTALSNSSTALSTANDIAATASSALSTANTASVNASTALSTANSISATASTALSTANAASTAATTATNTANSAQTAASTATENAATANTNATKALQERVRQTYFNFPWVNGIAEQAFSSGLLNDSLRQITIELIGVSTVGTSPLVIQLGRSGSYLSSGYNGMCTAFSGTGAQTTTATLGFNLTGAIAATTVISGRIVLKRDNTATHRWVLTSQLIDTATGTTQIVATGIVTLGAVIDRLRLTTAGGGTGNNFDSGFMAMTFDYQDVSAT